MNLSALTADSHRVYRGLLCGLTGAALLTGASMASAQVVTQSPLSSGGNVPGNMIFVPSVEFPTVISQANIQTDYATTDTYVGYFDSFKCYKYHYDSVDQAQRYFYPVSKNTTKTCNGGNREWSGNFMNWAATQTIDPFRQALTGGFRSTDTNSLTLLEKARYPDGDEGYYGNRRTPTSGSSTTLVQGAIGTGSWDRVTVRVARIGNRMFFANTQSTSLINQYSPIPPSTDYDGNTDLDGSNVNTLFSVVVRVKVCDNSVGLEPNCVQYGSNYKPEGLIQKYASRMRYSAFSYLNDSDALRDGGVMRARQKFVGPQRLNPSTGAWEDNPNKEWDPSTGVAVQNPDDKGTWTDAADTNTVVVAGGGAAAPTVSNSGVINYMNKFGEMTNTLDKGFDPVSEMYYSALRYLRGKTNVPEYSNLTGDSQNRYIQADGFPVITNWDDPLQYYCQNSAFLGIGDAYTWRDKNLKGNTTSGTEPAMPSAVNASGEPDAVAWSNRVSVLEGFGATMPTPFSGRENSAYIAGLAYYAHTQDLRPDVTTDALTKGMQTASTYWVDVRETQNTEPRRGNQYWLAAKYGGFTLPDPDANHVFTTSDFDSSTRTAALPQSWWDGGDSITSNGKQGFADETFPRAANYFLANQADKMYTALASAFAKIANDKNGAGSSLASNSTHLDATTRVYQALFSNGTWMGQLQAVDLVDTTGQPISTPTWIAGDVMPAPGARNIYVNAGGTAKTLTAGNLTSGQTTLFKFTGMGTATAQDLIDYFAGVQTNEESKTSSATRVFRVRTPAADWTPALGDIVNSTPVFVGAPNGSLYQSSTFSGASSYATFAVNQKDRTQALWVGANDGMLHGFNAATGVELYAFIPNQVISNGLAEYGNPDYVHKYFVDGDIAVADVWDTTSPGSWRTILVATLGRGGPGIFALDVTDPNNPIFLWEKGPSNISELGRNIGRPVIAQVADGDWRVILGNGMDTTSGAALIEIGVLNGTVSKKVAQNTSGNGLSAALVRDNNGDGIADTAYAGDRQGNLYKFTSLAASAPAVTTMFTTAANQPITAAPFAAKDPVSNTTWVFIGTGQFLNSADINTTATQSWYGIKDTGTAATLANLVQRTFTDTTVTAATTGFLLRTLSTGSATDLSGKDGWYINLPISGERMVLPNRFSSGVLLGTSLIPDTPDACKPTGRGVIMAINPYTGSRLDTTFFDANRDGVFDGGDTAGGTIASGLIDDTAMTQSISVGSNILWQDMEGGMTSVKTQGGAAQAGRLSWREITN